MEALGCELGIERWWDFESREVILERKDLVGVNG